MTFLSTFHPLSLAIFETATVVAFVLLHNSRFNFHCYTQREAMPTQKSARKWHCDLSQLLAWKITKGIHSCKPASPNRPKETLYLWFAVLCFALAMTLATDWMLNMKNHSVLKCQHEFLRWIQKCINYYLLQIHLKLMKCSLCHY